MAENAPVAIVTGGGQGIGAAICVTLLSHGYKVCVADIQEIKGKEFVAEQKKTYGGDKIIFSYCDVTQEDNYTRTFELAMSVFQRVDVLVNNAGIVWEQNPKKTLEVNLLGPLFGCQTALKYMGKSDGGKGGMVINTASICGFMPYSAIPAYCASKHGVIGLTRSYGLPYHEEREGVLFTALCPSFTETDLLTKSKGKSLNPNSDSDCTKRPNLLSPDCVAQGVMKLLKDRINGSTLCITHSFGYRYIGFENVPDD